MFGQPITAKTRRTVLNMLPNLFHQIFQCVTCAQLKSDMGEDSLSRSSKAHTAVTENHSWLTIQGVEMLKKQRPTDLIKTGVHFNQQRKSGHGIDRTQRKMPTLIHPDAFLINTDVSAPACDGCQDQPFEIVCTHIIHPVMHGCLPDTT